MGEITQQANTYRPWPYHPTSSTGNYLLVFSSPKGRKSMQITQ